MNRKEFLLSMMALGGTALASSANISHWEKVADQMIAEGVEASRKGRRKIDPTKAVLMSDIHICGELVDGVSKHYPYNPTSLKLRIAEILSMRRLPATFYGDIGFTVLRSTPEAATFEYSSKGFWWPQPTDNPPQAWKSRAEDLAHEEYKFLLK